MGSPKKAPALRQGHANDGATAAPVRSDDNVPPAPDHLGPEGVAVWESVWIAGGSFYEPSTDSPTIERYASMQERRIAYMTAISKEGHVTVGSQGQMVLHPLARMLSELEGKLTSLEDRLGLSPQARLNLGLSVVKVQSDLDKFLASTE